MMPSPALDANPGRRARAGAARSSRPFLVLLLAGLMLGGAGERYIFNEVVLAIAAAVLLFRSAVAGGLVLGPGARWLLGCAAVWAVLALLFLLPVPPAVWHASLGQGVAGSVLDALGMGDAWHALGLDPDRSMLFLLSLVLPVAGFWLTYSGSRPQSERVVQVLLAAALVSALLACLQSGSGGAPGLYVFATPHQGSGTGLYVNRNHLALLLLVAMPFLATAQAVPARWRGQGGDRSVRIGALILLTLGIVATVSRTAVVLLLPVILLTVLQSGLAGRLNRRWTAIFPVIAAVIAIAGLVASQMPVAGVLFDRFGLLAEDFRYLYWDNTLYLIGTHFPFGTGPGSFARLYASVEPLTQVRPEYVGHAHNDWLEIALEFGLAGIAGLAALVAVVAVIARRAIKAAAGRAAAGRAAAGSERPTIVAALAGLMLIGLFSGVDYPLRMPAIALLAGVLLGLVARMADKESISAVAPPARGWRMAWIGLGIAVCVILAGSVFSRQLVRAGLADLALGAAPWSGAALSAQAQALAEDGRWDEAGKRARTALSRIPLDPQAARILAGAHLAAGQAEEGVTWLSLAAGLGWRDRPVQEWVAAQAVQSGQAAIAAERYDALLRKGVNEERYYRELGRILAMPGGTEAIVARLEEQPGWARGFFNSLAAAPPPVARVLQLLGQLRQHSVPATGEDTALLRWTLWERGQYGDVAALWQASGDGALLGDGAFSALEGELPATAAPYAWSGPRMSGVTAVAITDAPSRAQHLLQVTSLGNAAGAFLAQSLALRPGVYSATLGASASPALPLRIWLECLDRSGQRREIAALSAIAPAIAPAGGAAGVQGQRLDFAIGDECPAQSLSIGIAKATGQEGEVLIEKIAIEKVAIDRAGTGRALD